MSFWASYFLIKVKEKELLKDMIEWMVLRLRMKCFKNIDKCRMKILCIWDCECEEWIVIKSPSFVGMQAGRQACPPDMYFWWFSNLHLDVLPDDERLVWETGMTGGGRRDQEAAGMLLSSSVAVVILSDSERKRGQGRGQAGCLIVLPVPMYHHPWWEESVYACHIDSRTWLYKMYFIRYLDSTVITTGITFHLSRAIYSIMTRLFWMWISWCVSEHSTSFKSFFHHYYRWK